MSTPRVFAHIIVISDDIFGYRQASLVCRIFFRQYKIGDPFYFLIDF